MIELGSTAQGRLVTKPYIGCRFRFLDGKVKVLLEAQNPHSGLKTKTLNASQGGGSQEFAIPLANEVDLFTTN